MASPKHADSKKNMYSWWWNSHISPKNSKWLQENLTDMDVKVKSMIKLIEEDADSFARRAEMYYKKRPELMKLVEEFYRAYRALAERYDHATGALRQAHQTMAEAFPNQVPMNPDDSPANPDSDPQTSEMSTPTRSFFDSEEFQKDASGVSLSQSEGRVRKGLNFNMSEEDGGFSETKKGGKMEKEILSLKDSLAKIEAEKEAALIQYEESLERLSKLGLEVALAQRKSRETTEQANKAEAEARDLKEALSRLEAEKEGNLLRYQKCLERITSLENDLSREKDINTLLDERAQEAEKEAVSLKQQLAKLESEKDAALEMISELEEKLRRAEEDAKKFSERAEKAEGEVVILKEMMVKLTEEKEAEGVLYQQCLKTIASLEHKLLLAQEEAERLNGEIDDGVAKLKGAEEQCVNLERSNESLHAELESMVLKMGNQSQELTEKQKELGRLWSSIQEERLRFAESEMAFQTLQNLHSQAQEELRSMASELKGRTHILEDMETRNQSLQEEILSYKEENKNLTELNLASATLTKDMRDEIFSLKESKGKLEDEIFIRTDERKVLQQEIYSLKEELNELNRKHLVILEQVDTVGLNPEFLGSSVKELQDDNLNLKDVCQRERSERLALLEKLEMKENSLSELQEESLKCKEENKILNKLNLAGAALTKDMRDEIFSLKDSKEKLEEEVERRVDHGNALQLEINSLKEELNKLNRKHCLVLEQVDAVGLKPESIGSSVRELRDENSKLKEVSQNEKSEKLTLLEKLVIMGQLLEKNAVLENSLSDLSAELEGVKVKLKVIEDSCRSLLREKSTLADENASLMDQLRVTSEDLEKLAEKNSVMEDSLSDSRTELEVLKSKSKSLEDLCQMLTVEKSTLITDKGGLVSEIEITKESLKDLEIRYAELEEKCSTVEKDRASTLSKVEELEKSLALQKQELENSLSAAHTELEVSKSKSKSLEDLCQLLTVEKSTLITDKGGLVSEIEITKKSLKDLEIRYAELEEKCSAVEKDGASTLSKVEELEKSLALQKQELENSLSDSHTELEVSKSKSKSLEDLCQLLTVEKSTLIADKGGLVSEIEITKQSLKDLEIRYAELEEKCSAVEKDRASTLSKVEELEKSLALQKQELEKSLALQKQELENSLSAAHTELEVSKSKSKSLEDLCQLLNVEKSTLITDKGGLVSEIEITKESLKDLEIRYAELVEKCSAVEKDRASTLSKVEELEKSLALQKQEHDHYALVSSEQLDGMEGQIRQLMEESMAKRKEFEEELDNGFKSLKDLEKRYAELEEKYSAAEKDRASSLSKVEELEKSLAVQKQEHDHFAQMSREELASMEGQIHQLMTEGTAKKKEFEEELNKGFKSLKDFEVRYAKLEEKCSAVERERASTFSKVAELEKSLVDQKQEHDHYAQMSTEQLVCIEGQIRQLKDEGMAARKEFEEELDKGFNLQTEIFILVKCIQDLEEKNSSLVNDFQKLLEASNSSEKLIFVLEKEKTENQVTIKSLSDHINALRAQMHQLLMVFDIGVDRNCEDKNGHDQTCLNHILSKAEDTKHALFKTEDESRQLAVEASVLVTLLTQLRTELENFESEKNDLDQELTAKNEKLLKLQDEADKLNERNEELGLKLKKGEQKEEVLVAQIENLRGELLEVHEAYGNLQSEKLQVCEEKMVLMKELSNVKEKVDDVEGQNGTFIDELYDQSVLSLVLKNYLEEKSVAICGLGEDLDKLDGVNTGLLEKLTVMERELEEIKMENRDLKEKLQKSEHELESVAFISDELNCEILNVKNLLGQKEREFSEAEEKLKLTEDEKTELHEIVEDLKREYDEVKMTSEEQGRQILELTDAKNLLSEEQILLQKTLQMLELELKQLHEERGKTIQMLESEAEENYGEMQASTIYQALLILKVRELAGAFSILQEENMAKDMNVESLEKREESLESENGGLKSQLAAYGSAVVSLRDCIVSLENRARSNEDIKGAELVNDPSVEGTDELSDFVDLQDRIKIIENSLIELERLRMQENMDAKTQLESVTSQMEELKLQQSYHKKERKLTSEILEVGTKDIVLDQESETSSQEKSKREGGIPLTYQDDNIDLTDVKSKSIVKPTSEDTLLEKELEVDDKLEISKKFEEPQVEGNKRKVLERLNSDDQKLTNLHITVQDLKKKVEITEKGKSGKAVVECDTIKAQLEEAEAAIQKLFDLTAKLMKNIEDSSFTLEKNVATELEKSQSTKRKKISEQARRISEKIGRLQLEVQKIQFVLLKLDDEKESKGRSRYPDTKRRVALKDYLYSGGRTKATIHKKKKAPFCACIDPPTSD